MKIINDPSLIKYRIALQAERDIQLHELGVFAADMQERVTERQVNNLPPISKGDEQAISKILWRIACAHFELQYGTYWNNLPEAQKDLVISNTAKILIPMITTMDPEIGPQIQIAAPFFLTQELKKIIPR